MTQKEKAERYERALKEAEDCHIDGLALSQPVKDVLEHIFPELKETEDERIKKAIKLMYSFLPNKPEYIGSVLVADIFAWLDEKYKEPQ